MSWWSVAVPIRIDDVDNGWERLRKRNHNSMGFWWFIDNDGQYSEASCYFSWNISIIKSISTKTLRINEIWYSDIIISLVYHKVAE
jgi:hypothetical protein